MNDGYLCAEKIFFTTVLTTGKVIIQNPQKSDPA